MVDTDVVRRKLGRAHQHLSSAERLMERSREAFLNDADVRDLATFRLFLALQEAIDLAAHWVADENLGSPDDVAGTFTILADRGEISPDLAAGMRAAVGLRHRIAHGYATVDHGRVLEEFAAGSEHLRQFLAAVARAAGL